ncbi:MAG: hypothetical protein ACRED5_15610 [Propylenella sp.]
MNRKTIARTAGALVILASIATATAPVQAGGSFPAAVERILMNQKEGRVSTLPAEKKRALITCVNQVLSEMPNGMKRFVLEASSYNDMESRFGKVVMENRAEWKQKIAQGCAHIVV